jgi:hypothetical protein
MTTDFVLLPAEAPSEGASREYEGVLVIMTASWTEKMHLQEVRKWVRKWIFSKTGVT